VALLVSHYFELTRTQKELGRVTTLAELQVVEAEWGKRKCVSFMIYIVCTIFHFSRAWLGGM